MFVTSGDVLLHSVATGPDPDPVLALNGWTASWQAWAPTFELLSRTRRCISYDTRGTAGSRCSADLVTLDALVDDVIRVMDAHQLERCLLAGESLGGFVALNAALRHPDRFTGLVLVAAAPVVDATSVGGLVSGARADYPATVRAFTRQCLSEPESNNLHAWGEQLFLGADPEAAARLFECCYGSVPRVDQISLPTAVIHGDADRVIPVDAGRYLAASIPVASYTELPGAGHAPTVTRPEDVAAVMLAMTG